MLINILSVYVVPVSVYVADITMYIHFRSLTEQIRTFHTATSITTELSHVLADLRVTGFPMKRKITFSTSLYTNNMLLFIYYILSGISTEERFRKTAAGISIESNDIILSLLSDFFNVFIKINNVQ